MLEFPGRAMEQQIAQRTTRSFSTVPNLHQERNARAPPGISLPKIGVAWEGLAASCSLYSALGDKDTCCRHGRTWCCCSPACRDSHPYIPNIESKIFFSLQGNSGKAFGKCSIQRVASGLAMRVGRIITYLCPAARQGCLNHLKAEVTGIFL